jgi:hypothetical protein
MVLVLPDVVYPPRLTSFRALSADWTTSGTKPSEKEGRSWATVMYKHYDAVNAAKKKKYKILRPDNAVMIC